MIELQDIQSTSAYVDGGTSYEVEELMDQAHHLEGSAMAEKPLIRAYMIEPQNLGVLLQLYHLYLQQTRVTEALEVAKRMMAAIAPQIDFPENWEMLSRIEFSNGVMTSFRLVRLYLSALTSAGSLSIKAGQEALGRAMLSKVAEFDPDINFKKAI
ncbi:MAG: hypothetical protein MI864_10695 [Pseudomonadales bacterium]|nr:hypothetical protein [Pseudomonadales bacterium]